ncbi:uncharacterized protein LOC124267266 isoform X2 [Haliotis rubra]|uniref:uncharacterized protein LOC124267266 isoform X2 n=1 Tax=Haliotis rubra TaxID=36100 RepID=UPI001EE5D7A3|nr:uncharacterized protein LOC124267266 isoform X2 [Haliotis rubra]
MAGNSYHASVISFKTSETSPAVLKLNITWGDNTHIVVAVTNQNNYLERILLLEKCEFYNFLWSGFSKSQLNSVLVWGLKDNPATGAGANPLLASYTVGTSRKVSVPQSGEPEERIHDLDLAGEYLFWSSHRMTDLMKTQDHLEMEVEHEPPLTYSLRPTGPSYSEAGLCVVYCERSQKEFVVMSSTPISTGIPLLPVCQSRNNYRVKVIGLTNNKGHTFRQPSRICEQNTPCGSSSIIDIKTCMSKDDLAKLLEKAERYCRDNALIPRKYPITQMYRNKPASYFDNIMSNRNGVMEKYLKDNNGDPYSAINHKISGLFFSGSFDTRETNPPQRPPNFSFFGGSRLFLPAEVLFSSDTRMYFADFFCHKTVHYVTAVVTMRGSEEDRFCEGRLIELDLKDNPFFTVTENISYRRNETSVFPNSVSSDERHPASQDLSSSETPVASPASSSETPVASPDSPSYTIQKDVEKTFMMTSVNSFHTEFLFTEDVDIKGLTNKYGENKVYRRVVQTRGKGHSFQDGIPKKAYCGICNLEDC